MAELRIPDIEITGASEEDDSLWIYGRDFSAFKDRLDAASRATVERPWQIVHESVRQAMSRSELPMRSGFSARTDDPSLFVESRLCVDEVARSALVQVRLWYVDDMGHLGSYTAGGPWDFGSESPAPLTSEWVARDQKMLEALRDALNISKGSIFQSNPLAKPLSPSQFATLCKWPESPDRLQYREPATSSGTATTRAGNPMRSRSGAAVIVISDRPSPTRPSEEVKEHLPNLSETFGSDPWHLTMDAHRNFDILGRASIQKHGRNIWQDTEQAYFASVVQAAPERPAVFLASSADPELFWISECWSETPNGPVQVDLGLYYAINDGNNVSSVYRIATEAADMVETWENGIETLLQSMRQYVSQSVIPPRIKVLANAPDLTAPQIAAVHRFAARARGKDVARTGNTEQETAGGSSDVIVID